MTYNFKNLVFEGGGVKGIAYIGAMKVLAEKEILTNIERVGGASAGAINATLIGLGFSPDDTKRILDTLDLNTFKDSSWGFGRDTYRLVNQFGWYKGNAFFEWISDIIARKTGNRESTFADIERAKEKKGFKSLYFIGANLSTSFSEVFSAESTPDMRIADAVRISMSIPLFFAARKIEPSTDIYVDGGLLDNYPVRLFDNKEYVTSNNYSKPQYYSEINEAIAKSAKQADRSISEYICNKETLGFRLDSSQEISVFKKYGTSLPGEAGNEARSLNHKKEGEIKDFQDYIWKLMASVLAAQQSSHLRNEDWARTIYIDTLGVGTTEFDLSEDKKTNLILSGEKGARDFFNWFDDDSEDKPNK